MISAVTKLEPDWYILEEDRDSDNPTKFLLGPLDQITSLKVGRLVEVSGDKGNEKISLDPEAIEIALLHGVRGWQNFKDSSGNDVLFTKLARENISRIPSKYYLELATEIMLRTNATEEDEKK